MKNSDLLTITNLKKYFPVTGSFWGRPSGQVKAVDGVSLVVKRGETLGLVGESGCGKTTLARCVLRIEDPTEGNVRFEGQELSGCDKRTLRRFRRDIQIIFQDPYSSLNPRRTVGQTIGEAFEIHGLYPPKERESRVKELMETVGLLPEHVHRYPHEFSGGQRQRICVARALSVHPKFIIADEPVSSLDVSIQAQILNLLIQLQRDFDLTFLFISHDLRVVRHISNRVAVMYLGRVVELADSSSLFAKPLHPYTQALMSAVPLSDPMKKRQRSPLRGDVPSPINPPSGCGFHPRCQFSEEICARLSPTLQEVEKGRLLACHLSGGY